MNWFRKLWAWIAWQLDATGVHEFDSHHPDKRMFYVYGLTREEVMTHEKIPQLGTTREDGKRVAIIEADVWSYPGMYRVMVTYQ